MSRSDISFFNASALSIETHWEQWIGLFFLNLYHANEVMAWWIYAQHLFAKWDEKFSGFISFPPGATAELTGSCLDEQNCTVSVDSANALGEASAPKNPFDSFESAVTYLKEVAGMEISASTTQPPSCSIKELLRQVLQYKKIASESEKIRFHQLYDQLAAVSVINLSACYLDMVVFLDDLRANIQSYAPMVTSRLYSFLLSLLDPQKTANLFPNQAQVWFRKINDLARAFLTSAHQESTTPLFDEWYALMLESAQNVGNADSLKLTLETSLQLMDRSRGLTPQQESSLASIADRCYTKSSGGEEYALAKRILIKLKRIPDSIEGSIFYDTLAREIHNVRAALDLVRKEITEVLRMPEFQKFIVGLLVLPPVLMKLGIYVFPKRAAILFLGTIACMATVYYFSGNIASWFSSKEQTNPTLAPKM